MGNKMKKFVGVVKVFKDKDTGLWYYEHSSGFKSQAIFPNRKKAWAKGNDYIDFIKGKY